MDSRRKRVLYRSNHCGMVENDIMLGGFATATVATMDDTDLDDFERILAEGDNDLYNWITGKQPVPEPLDNAVMAAVIAFNKRV